MTDRFKFRVWDDTRKKYAKQESLMCDFYIDYDGSLSLDYMIGDNIVGTSRHILIIESCTGLKDKNGNLIYENDLIDFYGKIYQIIWDSDFACFSIKNNNSMHPISDITQSIILGNINENPELLEQ